MPFQLKTLVLLFLLCGCSTPGVVRLKDQNISLTQLQRAVLDNLPEGKKKVSINGREFWSKPFVTREGRFKSPNENDKIRYQAHIFILGDRRPYDLEVAVNRYERETSGGSSFKPAGQDKGIARVIIRRIQKTLSERREDLNIIDDFRVF